MQLDLVNIVSNKLISIKQFPTKKKSLTRLDIFIFILLNQNCLRFIISFYENINVHREKIKIILCFFCFLVLSNISTCIFYLFVFVFFFFGWGIIHMMANSYKLVTSFPEYFPPTTLTPAVTATAIPRHTTTINKRNRLFKSTIYNENELIPYNRTLNGHNPGNDSYSDGQQLEIRCSGAIVRICT